MVLEQTKTFAQIRKSDTPPRVFFTFVKMCKWYQMARNVSNVLGLVFFFERKIQYMKDILNKCQVNGDDNSP